MILRKSGVGKWLCFRLFVSVFFNKVCSVLIEILLVLVLVWSCFIMWLVLLLFLGGMRKVFLILYFVLSRSMVRSVVDFCFSFIVIFCVLILFVIFVMVFWIVMLLWWFWFGIVWCCVFLNNLFNVVWVGFLENYFLIIGKSVNVLVFSVVVLSCLNSLVVVVFWINLEFDKSMNKL